MTNIVVNKTNIYATQRDMYTSGAVEAFPVHFDFWADWDGLAKVATFQAGTVAISVALDDTGDCTIPWEVLRLQGVSLTVGVQGTVGETVVIPTIWTSLGTIRKGATVGDNAADPTPTVYQQLIDQLSEGRDEAKGYAGTAQEAKDTAVSAQTGAESARDTAVSAATAAAASSQSAQESKDIAVSAANTATEAAIRQPIIQDGVWYSWSVTEGRYINTGEQAQGDKGEPGKDGYTPVKGVDYYTTEDIQGMTSDVQSAIGPTLEAIQATADKAEEVAKGRATGYVFDTVADMETWLTDSDNVAQLNLGDNLYIRATDVPDYWWDGSSVQQLETQKIDLTNYVKNTDYASTTSAGVVKVNPAYGSAVSAGGYLMGASRTLAQYTSGYNALLLAKGTLETIKSTYVKEGMAANMTYDSATGTLTITTQ